jgi:hippurate hydrolase
MHVPPSVAARIVALRRDLHRHPELSHQEHRTMERVADELRELGLEPVTGVAGTGVVCEVEGRQPGPKVALRADTDALPVHEETGLPFASEHDGVMHACGHDGHTSMLVGAAALLVADPPPLPVRLVFQPAEEKAAGAPAMIAEGVLDGVGLIFGGHLDRHYPPGSLVVTDGPVNASTDTFHLVVRGQQGHGARPHEAVDAVVVGSLLVTALQTIVSREVDPARPSVVSVGRFEAGSAPNVIAGRAVLEGTIRSQDPTTRAHLSRSITRIAKAIGELHGAEVDVQIRHGTPALCNEPGPTALARRAAAEVVGAEHVGVLHTANMGGEDFAYYLEHVPGCYIRYGAQVPGRESFPAHSSRFDIHEDALPVGAAWLDRVARVGGRHLLGERS